MNIQNTEPPQTIYTGLTITEKPDSEIEIVGEIPVTVAHRHRTAALKKIQKDLEISGFRKGHAPEDIVLEHVGEATLMQEVAERALSEAYAQIITDKKLDVVGRPAVTITKLAPGNPIGFKITSAVYPTVTLPKYLDIASKIVAKEQNPDTLEVTFEEIQSELERLRDMLSKAQQESSQEASAPDTKTDTTTQTPIALDDAFAQSLGDFKNLEDLKEKISYGLLTDKKQKAHDKRRLAIADAVIAKANVTVPNVFIEGELDQMVASFEERVTRAGLTLDAYLAQIKKTLEDLRKEWRSDAEKRAMLQLVFNEIAQKESIVPNTEKVEREVKHILEHYPEAQEHAVRVYVTAQMTNDLVFRRLEGSEKMADDVQPTTPSDEEKENTPAS